MAKSSLPPGTAATAHSPAPQSASPSATWDEKLLANNQVRSLADIERDLRIRQQDAERARQYQRKLLEQQLDITEEQLLLDYQAPVYAEHDALLPGLPAQASTAEHPALGVLGEADGAALMHTATGPHGLAAGTGHSAAGLGGAAAGAGTAASSGAGAGLFGLGWPVAGAAALGVGAAAAAAGATASSSGAGPASAADAQALQPPASPPARPESNAAPDATPAPDAIPAPDAPADSGVLPAVPAPVPDTAVPPAGPRQPPAAPAPVTPEQPSQPGAAAEPPRPPAPVPPPEPAPLPEEPAPQPAPAPAPEPSPVPPEQSPAAPPPLPSYPEQAPLKPVARDTVLKLAPELFTGTDPSHAPARIRIDAIQLRLPAKAATPGDAGAAGSTTAPDTAGTPGASGTPGAAATPGAAGAPASPGDTGSTGIAGTADATAPAGTADGSGGDDTVQAAPVLLLFQGTPKERAVQVGDTLSAEEFQALSWDARTNDGGSFSFTPLDASNQPIPQAAPRTITIHESPLPPDYSQPHTLLLAHDQTQQIDSAVFAGAQPGRAPAMIRIESLELAPETAGAPAPVAAGGLFYTGPDGQPVSVAQGDTLSAAQYASLHWRARGNAGGQLRFSALDDNGVPIAGADTGQLTVSEAPPLPSYDPARSQLSVPFDASLRLDPLLFTGMTIEHRPAAIVITAIQPAADNGQGLPALVRHHPATASQPPAADSPAAGQSGAAADPLIENLRVGSIVPFAAFRHIHWQAQGNEGGSFSFKPASAEGHPLAGAVEQTITLTEQDPTPDYRGNKRLDVGHDQVLLISADSFEGNNPRLKPAAVRLDQIRAEGSDQPLEQTLFIEEAGARRYLHEGDRIDAADFARLHWDSASTTAGHILFTALDRQGQPISMPAGDSASPASPAAGSTPGADSDSGQPRPPAGLQRRLSIVEHPEAPRYPDDAATVRMPHDSQQAIDPALFTGSGSPAGHVRITAIEAQEPQSGQPALLYDHDNDPGTPMQAVPTDRSLAAATLAQLHWNAAHNAGGSIRFVPTLADGTPLIGSSEQSIRIHESPLPPDYRQSVPSQGVVHDGTKTFDAVLFEGQAPENKPAYIRIEAITANNASSTGPALWIGPAAVPPAAAGSAPPSGTAATAQPVAVNQIIAAAQFSQLQWQAAGNEGGSFRFIALDQHQQPIADALGNPVGRTITVHESPQAPDYRGSASLSVVQDQTLAIPASMLAGDNPASQPARVLISGIQPSGQTASGQPALYLDEGGNRQPVTENTQLSQAQFHLLRWDSSGDNTGGQFSLTAIDAQGRPIEGAAPRTVIIEEFLPPPSYPDPASGPVEIGVRNNGIRQLPAELFAGNDPAHAPAYIRISWSGVSDSNTPLSLDRDGDGPGSAEAVQQNQILSQAEYQHLSWNAAANEGGTLHFQPLNASQQPINGTDVQQITIYESPPIPRVLTLDQLYITDKFLTHNTTAHYDHNIVGGPDHQIPFARLVDAEEKEDRDPNTTGLFVSVRRDMQVAREVAVGDILSRDDGNMLVWNGHRNSGGSFTLQPLDANKRPIEGLDPVKYIITEFSAIPDYAGEYTNWVDDRSVPFFHRRVVSYHENEVRIAFNEDVRLDREIFAGRNPALEPARVRLLWNPSEKSDYDETTPAMTLRKANGEVVPLQKDSIIEFADFGNVYWDTRSTAGGTFSFKPYDHENRPIVAYVRDDPKDPFVEHEVRVSLIKSNPPVSQDTGNTTVVGYNTITMIDKAAVHYIFPPTQSSPTDRNYRVLAVTEQVDENRQLVLYRPSDWFWPLETRFKAIAYELVRTSSAIDKETARQMAEAAGGRLLSIDGQYHPQEAAWLQTHFFGPQGVSSDAVMHEQSSNTLLHAFAIEYHNHTHPLVHTADKQEWPSPLASDSTYGQQNMERLQWDSSNNIGGVITFAKVDSGYGYAKVSSEHRTITLTEAPPPAQTPPVPAAPAEPANYHNPLTGQLEIGVRHNHIRQLPAELFASGDPAQPPEYIRISWSGVNSPRSPLLLNFDGSNLRAAETVQQNRILSRAEYQKLSWNATDNEGGILQVEALDASQQPIAGINARQITVYESPPVPRVLTMETQDNNDKFLAYNGFVFYDSNIVSGLDHEIPFARVIDVQETDDLDPNTTGLFISVRRNQEIAREVSVGDILSPQDGDRLVWAGNRNSGGSFTLQPLDANKRPIEGLDPVTYKLTEFGPIPDYPGTYSEGESIRNNDAGYRQEASTRYASTFRQTLSLPYQAMAHLDRELFAGRDPAREPARVRILGDGYETEDLDRSSPALQIRRDSGEVIPLRTGNFIEAEDFGNVYWDTSTNLGGELRLMPHDHNNNPIARWTGHPDHIYLEVHLSLREGDPPLAGGTLDAPVLGHDTRTMIDQRVFQQRLDLGSQGERKNFLLLSVIEQVDSDRQLFLYRSAQIGNDPEVRHKTSAYELVNSPEGISKAEAQARAEAAGGRLLSIDAEHEGEWLRNYFFAAQGTTAGQVLHAQSQDGTAHAFAIEYENHDHPLSYRVVGTNTDYVYNWTPNNQYQIGPQTFDRMVWDSTHNIGGQLIIAPSDNNYVKASPVGAPVTITLTEAAAPASATSKSAVATAAPQQASPTPDDQQTPASTKAGPAAADEASEAAGPAAEEDVIRLDQLLSSGAEIRLAGAAVPLSSTTPAHPLPAAPANLPKPASSLDGLDDMLQHGLQPLLLS